MIFVAQDLFPPKKPGWYYGRPKANDQEKIRPVLIKQYGATLLGWDEDVTLKLDYWIWFGPVPEVRESGT